jgi:hypothetical protein
MMLSNPDSQPNMLLNAEMLIVFSVSVLIPVNRMNFLTTRIGQKNVIFA